jgi:hypothetical protein
MTKSPICHGDHYIVVGLNNVASLEDNHAIATDDLGIATGGENFSVDRGTGDRAADDWDIAPHAIRGVVYDQRRTHKDVCSECIFGIQRWNCRFHGKNAPN